MNKIEKNLVDFYLAVAQTAGCLLYSEPSFRAVKGTDGGWPDLVFAPDYSLPPAQLLPLVSRWIGIHGAPRNLVIDSAYLNRNHLSLLRDNGFFPVDSWQMMQLSLRKTIVFPRSAAKGQFRELEHPADFEQFCGIANRELLGNMPVSPQVVQRLSTAERFRFWGVFVGEELIAALLVFAVADVAGLYLVAARKEFQLRGFGSLLLQQTLKALKSSAIRSVVLHASRKAVPLYEKFGFANFGNLYIYRKTE
ncbi:MAG TPA: GNAT family N-acetyltransferase [Prolixibacteraceae bacterium]|nr:GNAT family N-acetyltransferase [Prolixibacteraceae bacterium]